MDTTRLWKMGKTVDSTTTTIQQQDGSNTGNSRHMDWTVYQRNMDIPKNQMERVSSLRCSRRCGRRSTSLLAELGCRRKTPRFMYFTVHKNEGEWRNPYRHTSEAKTTTYPAKHERTRSMSFGSLSETRTRAFEEAATVR